MASSGETGIFTTDAALVVTSWDDGLASLSGIPRDGAVGQPIATLVPDLERRALLGRFLSALEAGTVEVLAPALHHYLIACPPRTPSPRFDRMQQRVTIGPLLDRDTVVGLLVTVEDVTARLDAERDLAEQRPSAGQLASDDWRVRQAAVQKLAAEGDGDFVKALVASLRHGHRDFNLLSSVLKLLGSTNVEVTGALVELLADPDADLRIQAALALGEQHDPAAIPPLRSLLQDPDVNVRFQAIESLGRLRADAALDDLMTIVESGDFFLSFAALDAVGAINDPRVALRIAPLLESDALRVPVAEALGRIGDERAAAPLVNALAASSRGVVSIAAALASIHDRLEREYHDGRRIADEVRARATATTQDALVQAIPVASGDELRALVRVLGWLEGEGVQKALTRLLADASVRAEVIEALVRHGDGVVDRLVAELESEDPDVRRAAVVALGRVGSPRATPGLVALLDDEPDLLVATTGALARIGDKAAFEPLLPLLGHPDGAVRQSAIGALNSIGHPGLARRIAECLNDPSPLVRESAVRIAGYFGYPETVDELFVRARDEDEAVRRAAVEHLPFVDDPRVLPVLIAALERDTPRARAAAARALGRVEDRAAATALDAALQDGDSWVRYFAVRALVDLRHAPSVSALLSLAEHDPATHVRIAALDALGALGPADALPVLQRLANDAHPEVAAAALGALGRTADASGWQALRDAIRSDAPSRRLAAVAALAAHGTRDAVASLEWPAATDPDSAVVKAAIEGLGHIAAGNGAGASHAVDALLLLLSDRDKRAMAQEAIARLSPTQIGELSRGLQHPQPEVRRATVDVLGRFQCETATKAVESALADSVPAVREAAVATLARLGARGLEPVLTQLSAHDPSKAVRRAAAAALIGLRP